MLKKIISITGKPGLQKILSQGRGTLIVEDVETKRRFPVHSRDQVVSLGDISMYTESGDTPLGEIMQMLYEKTGGKPVDGDSMNSEQLHQSFGDVVTDYDRLRVRDRDIKKLYKWYNLLLADGFTKFVEDTDDATDATDAAATETPAEGKAE
jgi:hypothetical protein